MPMFPDKNVNIGGRIMKQSPRSIPLYIFLFVNTPESLLCYPTCAKFSRNHMHSIMNLVPALEEEENTGIKLTVIGATCILLNTY